jgi:GT2 family glycosyltransferase
MCPRGLELIPRTRPSLLVAIVLYGNEKDVIRRTLLSLDASAGIANLSSKAKIKLGDCSDIQIFSFQEINDLGDQLKYSELEYLPWGENLHHSLGINRLCADSTEEAFLILNPDSILAASTISEMLQLFDGKALIEARQFPIEHTKPFDPNTGLTTWNSGCCLLVAANLFKRLEGFDHEVFPNYANDVDFSWRAKLCGSDSKVAVNAFVYHDKQFDSVTQNVAVSELEDYESKVSYLLMLRKYKKDVEYSKTILWLSKNLENYDSIKKTVLLRLSKIKSIDSDLIDSTFFSIRDGRYGPSNVMDLILSNRDLKYRASRESSMEQSLS